jgi:hypothetical protein
MTKLGQVGVLVGQGMAHIDTILQTTSRNRGIIAGAGIMAA